MLCRVVTEGSRIPIIVAKAIFIFATVRVLHEYFSSLSVNAVVYYLFKLPINQLCFQQMKQICASYNTRFLAFMGRYNRIWHFWLLCGIK
jgi:hypothetical protein